jgi:hypothetical protein
MGTNNDSFLCAKPFFHCARGKKSGVFLPLPFYEFVNTLAADIRRMFFVNDKPMEFSVVIVYGFTA